LIKNIKKKLQEYVLMSDYENMRIISPKVFDENRKNLENIKKNSPEVFEQNRIHLEKFSNLFDDDPEMNSFFNTFILNNPKNIPVKRTTVKSRPIKS